MEADRERVADSGLGARVMLIGLGPHARRIYSHYLAEHGAGPHLVVELATRREETLDFLKHRNIIAETCFLDPEGDSNETLSETNIARLDAAVSRSGVTHVINSGASHTHFAYLKYLISRGLRVLTDKPITAPTDVINDAVMARRIQGEFDTLRRLYEPARARGAKIEVQCQRRYHVGFRYVRQLIAEVVSNYGIPITHIDIYHCDGMWNMPSEFLSRDDHAYKTGSGKLFHSGYHFIDLLAWLLAASRDVDDSKRADQVELYATAVRPADALSVIGSADYKRLFGDSPFDEAFAARSAGGFDGMGEVDFHSILQMCREGRTICTATLTLLQSGFSRRAWLPLPKDTYKGNGRVRHERLNIQIGPLLNIQVHSYQAREAHERAADDSAFGATEHFDIHIFRNVGLIGGEPLRTLGWRDLGAAREREGHFIGYNEQAKEICMIDFLNSRGDDSDLIDHAASVQLLSQSYLSLAQRARGLSPIVHFPIVF